MLIEEVDAIGAKPLERSFDDALDMIGLAVEPGTPLTVSGSMFQPNLDVITTLFRNGWIASPRMRSHSAGRRPPQYRRSDAAVVGRPDEWIFSGRYGTVVSYLRLMFWTPSPTLETSRLPSLRRPIVPVAGGLPVAGARQVVRLPRMPRKAPPRAPSSVCVVCSSSTSRKPLWRPRWRLPRLASRRRTPGE